MRKLILPILIVIGIFYLVNKPQSIVSPIPLPGQKNILGIFNKQKDPEQLRNKVIETIGNSWKNYSVYVVDLNSSFAMGINEREIFTAASLNKIPILAALYAEEKKETVDFDRMITIQPEDVQDYGTGSIRYDPPGSSYSVKTLARLMMQKSDNTAAHVLANLVLDTHTIQSLIATWGLSQTNMATNKTSNADMAKLMMLMHDGKITDEAHTAEMMGFMRNSDFENRLPGLLPKSAVVYHKIGTGETGEVHDVGIVSSDDTSYYVGILTTNAGDETEASALLTKVSKVIYDFMQ